MAVERLRPRRLLGLDGTLATAFTDLVCYVFERAVEKPSHELARQASRWILERDSRALTAT